MCALQVEFNFLEAEAQFGVEMDGLDVESAGAVEVVVVAGSPAN